MSNPWKKLAESEDTIVFTWYTGSITVLKKSLLDESAAYLKKLLKTAEKNRTEVSEELQTFIQENIDALDPKNCFDKKKIEKYSKLLDVFADRKQTREEKVLSKMIAKDCSREEFQGIVNNAGKYCIVTNYYAIRLSSRPYGIADAKRQDYNLNKAIGNVLDYSIELELPRPTDMRKDIKIARENTIEFGKYRVEEFSRPKKVYYDFGYNKPMVNAEYLLQCLDALPDCKAYYNPNCGKKSFLYIVAGDNDGIIMPVVKEYEIEKEPENATEEPESAQETRREEPRPETTTTTENATEDAESKEETEEERRAKIENRLSCVVAAVTVSENDANMLDGIIRQFRRGFITEDESIKLLLFPVSATNKFALALPEYKEPDPITEPEEQEPEESAAAWYNPQQETAADVIKSIAAGYQEPITGDAETVNNVSGNAAEIAAGKTAANAGSIAGSVAADPPCRVPGAVPVAVFVPAPVLRFLNDFSSCSARPDSSFCALSVADEQEYPRPP